MTTKKVNLDLEGLDGNAFMLLGTFNKQAKREGCNTTEIKEVITEAQKNDYAHLVQTLMAHCK